MNVLQNVREKKIGTVKGKAVRKLLENANQNPEAFLEYYKVSDFSKLTEAQHLEIVRGLESRGYGSNGKD